MITREEERELIRRFQQDGDESARAALVESHKRYVWKIAGKLLKYRGRRDVSIDELAQVGLVKLWRAIPKFDLSRNLRLLTFATPCMYWGMTGSLAGKRFVNVGLDEFLGSNDAISLDALTASDDGNARPLADDEENQPDTNRRFDATDEDSVFDGDWDLIEKHTFLRESLAKLDDRERFVIERRCLGDELRVIGEDMGITKERVRQLEMRAISKLRELAGVQTAVSKHAPKALYKNPARVQGYANGHKHDWKSKMLAKMKERHAST